MPVRPDFDPSNLYFITTTAVNHAHLFRRDVNERIVVDSLSFMRANHWLRLHVLVIMPNHVHVIVRFLGDRKMPDVMRDFKKHTAKQIIHQ